MIEPAYRLITTQDMVGRALKIFSTHSIIGVDIETNGLECLDKNIITIQVATPKYAYIFPVTLDLSPLSSILTKPDVLKIIHNAPFDFGFIFKHLGIVTRPVWDTKAAERMILGKVKGEETRLSPVAYKYTGTTLVKGEITTSFKENEALTEEQLKYGALDSLVLLPIYIEQERLLRPQNKCGLLMAQVARSLEKEQERIESGERR